MQFPALPGAEDMGEDLPLRALLQHGIEPPPRPAGIIVVAGGGFIGDKALAHEADRRGKKSLQAERMLRNDFITPVNSFSTPNIQIHSLFSHDQREAAVRDACGCFEPLLFGADGADLIPVDLSRKVQSGNTQSLELDEI